VQFFAGTAHAEALAVVLASAADQALPADQVEVHVLAAAEKLRRASDQRAVNALLAQPLSKLSTEDRRTLTERIKAARNRGTEPR